HIVGDSNAVISGLNLPRRSSTIYAGKDAIDQDEIAQAETDWLSRPGLATSTQRIIYVGRIAYNKGVDVLAEAAALLHAQFPDLHFVIVGEAGKTDQGFRRFLDQRIQQLGIAQCWHELGSRNDVLSIMTHCDIVVLPSRREAFGLVMQEAAQVARPVVGANIGGIPETMIPDETGLLFTPEDPSDLAQKIAYLLQHPEQARQMGIVGQHFVRDNFTKARYHQQFVALYNSFEAR
ncbi:MAG: glycosyltransferase family 4 protein, partial [Anaerolineae bacterium]|nr:glycosyltransferase family 4 protein [Anaerolineae bacterium]